MGELSDDFLRQIRANRAPSSSTREELDRQAAEALAQKRQRLSVVIADAQAVGRMAIDGGRTPAFIIENVRVATEGRLQRRQVVVGRDLVMSGWSLTRKKVNTWREVVMDKPGTAFYDSDGGYHGTTGDTYMGQGGVPVYQDTVLAAKPGESQAHLYLLEHRIQASGQVDYGTQGKTEVTTYYGQNENLHVGFIAMQQFQYSPVSTSNFGDRNPLLLSADLPEQFLEHVEPEKIEQGLLGFVRLQQLDSNL